MRAISNDLKSQGRVYEITSESEILLARDIYCARLPSYHLSPEIK